MQGTCDARFAAVREALEENLASRGELGAAVAVRVEGRPVVDLWCGHSDGARTRGWREDTLVNCFSVGKALAGTCVLMLVSRGLLGLEERVAERWPRFAQAGKEEVTVRQLLGHRAGLAAIEAQLPDGALYDWARVSDALAAQQPWWEPGSDHGYHVHTFGFLAGELVRRVAGESIGSFMSRELAEPLGAEVSFGLPPPRRARRAEYVFDAALPRRVQREGRAHVDPHLYERAYLNPPGATGLGTVNTAAWQDAELPSANLHADARSLARVYDALLDPHAGPLAPEILREATAEASAGIDRVLGRPSRFGLGFQLTQPERPLGPGARGFGHFGAGGSLAFADPDARVAFAYVMNRGGPQWQDPRNRALVEAVYGALGAG
ncbi:MAG TPA: serine hydrolase domain-containing protein [Solirubrobacteraceae bacterium]|nr:serine hydrolase domain-containing protein [Solirubrobacteraceae bacterium]